MYREKILENEAYLQAFNHAPIGMAFVTPDGEWIHGNAALSGMLGYTYDELKNLTFQKVSHPADLDDELLLKDELLQGKRDHYRLEKRFIHKQGFIVWGLLSVSLVRNDQGHPHFFIKQIVDITVRKEVEIELQEREHEALFRLISEHSQDVIFYINQKGVNEYVSPVVQSILGYEPGELLGKRPIDFYHPDDLDEIMKSDPLQQADQGSFITRVRHKEGHYVWMETTVKIIRNSQGEIEKILGVGRDITKRRVAEEELRKTKQRLESIVRNNADAIWMIDLDENTLEVNATFESMFGWKKHEVIGKPLLIIPQKLTSLLRQLHDRVKEGVSVMGFETICQRKDGGTLHVSVTLSPVRDAKGNVVGISGVCRDITTRKQAEKEAKTTKEQLQAFIDDHVDAIVMFSKEGIVIRVNPAFEKMFGWQASEILGLYILNAPHIPEHFRDQVLEEIGDVMLGHHIKIKETQRVSKDGDSIDIMLTGFPFYDSQGEFNGWSVILRDITEWKKSQEILQNSEKLTLAGQLAAGIAHEIRNPITSIKGFLQLMQTGFEQKKEYFEIMTAEIKRIEMILSELLVLAKPQVVKFERKDIRLLLTQVITLLDTQAIMNNVQIKTEFTPGISHTCCDENQLKQVFINFIKNGIEAMPKGGSLTIQVKAKGQRQMLLRFIDQGCGIPEGLLSKIGQPFYTTKENGTGLGFMVSKKIIENHNGEINIQSKVKEGTTIEVTLPLWV